MIHASHRATQLIVLFATLGFAAAAHAALKAKPPEGVKLEGIEWKLDPYRSDDPQEAIDRAQRRADDAKLGRQSSDERGSLPGGGDDPFGRGNRQPGDRLPSERLPSDRGGWGGGSGRTSTDIDPTGGTQSATFQIGGARRTLFFEQLRTNPDALSFDEGNQYVIVTADGLETECEPGVKAPISDSYGDGERNCGWSGRAWVVETKRKGFSRTDRYELSKDGKSLKFTTSATGDGLSVKISRTYGVAPTPLAR